MLKAVGIFLLVGASVCASAVAAAAQTSRTDVSGGYQFVRVTGDQFTEGISLPVGWTVSFSRSITPLVTAVGEVNGSYGDNVSLHSFLGGARFGAPLTPRLTGFGQVLAGLAHGSSNGYGENGLNVQPGVGADFQALNKLGLRVQADYLIIRSSGVTTNAFRVSAGVVFEIGR